MEAVQKISLAQARRLAFSAGAGFFSPSSHGSIAEVVTRIGFIQIDTISVVERAHHHALFTRIPAYRPSMLSDAADGIFEYWAHAAAYLPWTDFRFTLVRKQRIRENGHDWFRVDKRTTRRVLDRIRGEGPLMARDFEAPGKMKGWWDWKPAKRALEYLFHAGELMALPRSGFQKVFDLTERVLPPKTDTRAPDADEMAQWYVQRALDAYGLIARDEIAYQRKECIEGIRPILEEMGSDGRLVRVEVESIPNVIFWARPESLNCTDKPAPVNELRILSPFDPFVINRKRIKRLFQFDYRLECYLPVEKRVFGYFALPLLFGETFAGIMDAKAERTSKTLIVNRVRCDGKKKRRKSFESALKRSLKDFAAFNGCKEIDFQRDAFV